MRLPAEWEPQGFVQLTWPHKDSLWYEVEKVQECYTRIVSAILRYEPVLMVCRDRRETEDDLRRCGLEDVSGIRFVQAPINDTWARDHGGISVYGDSCEKVVLDFVFNGWGLKFASDFDNQITRRAFEAGAFNAIYRDMRPYVLEGGSIDTDGAGTLLTTSECLLSLNRNEYLSKEEVEQRLKSAFGLKRILWIDYGGIPEDENYAPLKAMEEQLKGFRTLEGNPYELIPLPLPEPLYLDDYRLPASYANFLIINGAVLMPGAGSPLDDVAASRLQEAFPDRKVEVIDCRPLLSGHGGLHCVTMNYPAGW